MTTPLRWSNLRYMAKSPYHYQYYLKHPVAETAAMRIGGYAHHLVLGDSGHKYAVYDGTRRGAAWEAFRAEHPNHSILNENEAELAHGCADGLRSHGLARSLIEEGIAERRIEWTMGLVRRCSGTPDLCGDARWVADIKVTSDASPAKLRWQALRMLWHGQLAWYGYGLQQAFCTTWDTYYIIAVEQKPPHAVCVYRLTPNAVISGVKLYTSLVNRLQQCEETNDWPAYSSVAVDLEGYDETDDLVFDTGEEE